MHKLLFLALLSFTLNANTVDIKIPEVPKVPKVEAKVPQVNVHTIGEYKTNEEILQELTKEKVVHFSDHVAPEFAEEASPRDEVIEVGDVKNGRVSAYLRAPIKSAHEVTATLKEAGFEVLSTYKVDKKGLATSIVFTNPELIKAASKKNRGFASSLRITIDKKDKIISITNPLYILKAFQQDNYDEALAKATLKKLRDAFKNLENSDEILKERILAKYQFMAGMPKYEDMQSIKKLSNAKLLAKAKKSKKIVYQIDLLNGSTLIGVKLGKRTSKFIKKIGYKNAGLLPYPVLIENGEAKILDPKYYIAIMYPMLKMSQFMTIATVPGAINKDVDRVFR
jgi:hypothetical protein